MLTQAHACGRALVAKQTIDGWFVDFAGTTCVWPQVPDCLALKYCFCFVLSLCTQGIQAPPLTDNPYLLFCFDLDTRTSSYVTTYG